MGGVVAINGDLSLSTMWDIENEDIPDFYKVVARKLSAFVKRYYIKNTFLHYQKNVGIDHNIQLLESGETIKWNHFACKLPTTFVAINDSIGSKLSVSRALFDVSKRSLEEITSDAVETVIDLISQNSIYRGEEFLDAVNKFYTAKKNFEDIPPELRNRFCWSNANPQVAIRNTVIGSLLVDLSDGVEINEAVGKFEAKVAPVNYKRPKAIFTKKMIANAQSTIDELGFTDSLPRRFAVIDDITINNVIFANRDAKRIISNDVFEELASEVETHTEKFDRVEEVSIEKFIKDILPKTEAIELYVENTHISNMVSLIAPINPKAPTMFKWHNNFSWAYQGNIADSMKQRVKKAGGNVDGVLRFSIQWNEDGDNQNDFDAHCVEPGYRGKHIYYANKTRVHSSSGVLDIDIQNPRGEIAVENITWSDKSQMPEGEYQFYVKNFAHRGGKSGFKAQIEYEGKIFDFNYDKELKPGEIIRVANVTLKNGEFKITPLLSASSISKSVWGIKTQQFVPVSVIMFSPNYWDGKKTGNKHYFFMLQNCINDSTPRGFFNEFLKQELLEHKRVFEALGSKMSVAKSTNQLSGLGFSSTQRNSILCKTTGSFISIIKLKF